MLTTAADRLPRALADLDPGNRALLDLSLRRGISATEIGELLRKDPEQVTRGVDDVLELLADALGLEGDDRRERVRDALLDLPEAAWQARPPAAQPPPPAPPAVPRPSERGSKQDYLPYFTPKEERPRAWPIALLVLLVSGVVVATILIFSAGGSEEDDSPATPDAREKPPVENRPTPQPEERSRSVRLRPLPGATGGGRATLNEEGDRLEVSIEGLPKPRGAYEIWVYSSIVDAQSLGSFSDTKIEIDARLPDNLENYRYVDVSLEPPDGNPNHSGDSVLRAPVDDLLIE